MFSSWCRVACLFHQVVFDESLQRCLDSYLHHAPRGLDLSTLPSSPAVADMQRSIHKAVFLTFLRMATHKESKVGKLDLQQVLWADVGGDIK